MTRNAFSLLEIIIATAVLAASAMVLSSLIGLGSQYGNRAEERTLALSQAESLMDEFLAQLGSEPNQIEESSGELPGPPRRGFRIRAVPFELGNATSSLGSGVKASVRSSGLLMVMVEVFETASATASGESKPLVELARLIRTPQLASTDPLGSGPQADALNGVAPAAQGAFP